MGRWLKTSDRTVLAAVLLLAGLSLLYPFLKDLVNKRFLGADYRRANGTPFIPSKVRVVTPHIVEPRPVRIDINRARASRIGQLKGIGPVLADRIVKYRRENGDFRSLQGLLKIRGIGEDSLEKLIPHAKAGKPTAK